MFFNGMITDFVLLLFDHLKSRNTFDKVRALYIKFIAQNWVLVYNQSINHQSIDGVTLPHLHPTSSLSPLLSCPQRHEFIIHPWLSKFNATSPHSLCPPTGPCSYSPISSPLSSLCIPISPTYVKLLYYIIVIIFYRNSKSQITLESISKGCSWFMVESRGE